MHVWDSGVSTDRTKTCWTGGNALIENAAADITSSKFYLTGHLPGLLSAGRTTKNFVPSQTNSHIRALVTEPDGIETLYSGMSDLEQNRHTLSAEEKERSMSSFIHHQSLILTKTDASSADADKDLDKRECVAGSTTTTTTGTTTPAKGQHINLFAFQPASGIHVLRVVQDSAITVPMLT